MNIIDSSSWWYLVTVFGSFFVSLVTAIIIGKKKAKSLPGGGIGLSIAMYAAHTDMNLILFILSGVIGFLSFVYLANWSKK